MRFKEMKEGDKRIVRFFALLPVTIGDETRWLEKVKIRQVCTKYRYPTACKYEQRIKLKWDNSEFIDD